MPQERFEKAAQNWDENPGRLAMTRNIATAIRAHVPVSSEWTAIDYGCGTGLITLAIQPHLQRIVGFDSSTAMLSKLKEKVEALELKNVDTLLTDLETDAEPDMKVDLITSAMTLHHIEDIPAVLKKLATLIKPNGYIALADLDTEDGTFHADNTGVRHFGLDRDWLMSVLEELGFTDLVATTAHVAVRDTPNGEKSFKVFLVCGRKG